MAEASSQGPGQPDPVQEYLRLLAQGETALKEGLAAWDRLNHLWWSMSDEQHAAIEAALAGGQT